jgi:hypothetical protein
MTDVNQLSMKINELQLLKKREPGVRFELYKVRK